MISSMLICPECNGRRRVDNPADILGSENCGACGGEGKVPEPSIQAFLQAWHENGRAEFERSHDRLVYNTYAKKVAKDRKKYIALDVVTEPNVSGSGMFLLDRTTLDVYSIRAYGVPNRKIGSIEDLTRAFRRATDAGWPMPRPGYAHSDQVLSEWAERETP